MTDHPITPPRALAAAWVSEIYGDPAIPLHPITLQLIERSAQWGYDQRGEVNEAKLQQARDHQLDATLAEVSFLTSRVQLLLRRLDPDSRLKPPSDKEQACKLLECYGTSGVKLTADQCNTIRKALEDSNV